MNCDYFRSKRCLQGEVRLYFEGIVIRGTPGKVLGLSSYGDEWGQKL